MISKCYQLGLELRHVSAFAVLSETLNFRESARRLGITQPALSMQIKLLEQRLGQKLFVRSTRRVVLTAAGRRMRRQAETLLRAGDDLVDSLRAKRSSGPVGKLVIWYGTQAMFTVLPDLLRDLHIEAPGIEFELVDATTEQIGKALKDDRADIGFLHPPIERRGLESRVLLRESFCLALPAGHRLARRRRALNFAALAEETILLHDRTDGPMLYDDIMGGFSKVGVTPRLGPRSCQPQNTLGLVAAGIGIGFVCASMRAMNLPGVTFRDLVGFDSQLGLAVARRAGDDAEPVAWFWNRIQKNHPEVV